MPDSDRVSIWSIAKPWVTLFYILFAIQILGVICLVSWREIFIKTDDTTVETVMAIGAGSAPNIITSAAVSLVLVLLAEVITMLAEPYLRRRFQAGKEEGKEEGKAEGIKQERARSRRYATKLRAWAEGKVSAAEKGEPFDEPMPEPDDDEDAA